MADQTVESQFVPVPMAVEAARVMTPDGTVWVRIRFQTASTVFYAFVQQAEVRPFTNALLEAAGGIQIANGPLVPPNGAP